MQVGTLSFSHPSFGVSVLFIYLLGCLFSFFLSLIKKTVCRWDRTIPRPIPCLACLFRFFISFFSFFLLFGYVRERFLREIFSNFKQL